MTNSLWKPMGLSVLLIFLFSNSQGFSQTKDAGSSHKDSAKHHHVDLKAQDLPAPIPKVMETLQRIGNKTGKELSNATAKATNVVNNAVREDKPSDRKEWADAGMRTVYRKSFGKNPDSNGHSN